MKNSIKSTFIYGLLLLVITSCNIVNIGSRDDEAIKLVQDGNFGLVNIVKINPLLLMALTANSTNLEFANFIASEEGNEKFEWKAKQIKGDTYLVMFLQSSTGKGFFWEVNLDSKIVRYVLHNSVLLKKYKQEIE